MDEKISFLIRHLKKNISKISKKKYQPIFRNIYLEVWLCIYLKLWFSLFLFCFVSLSECQQESICLRIIENQCLIFYILCVLRWHHCLFFLLNFEENIQMKYIDWYLTPYSFTFVSTFYSLHCIGNFTPNSFVSYLTYWYFTQLILLQQNKMLIFVIS